MYTIVHKGPVHANPGKLKPDRNIGVHTNPEIVTRLEINASKVASNRNVVRHVELASYANSLDPRL